jgi:succinate dehydrogenase/fumarate reductase flavoprotein subunit
VWLFDGIFLMSTGVDFGAFRNTLEDYSAAASAAAASGGGQSLDPFGKTTFPVSEFSISEELYVANVTPVIHYTMGGVKVCASHIMCSRGL